MELWNPPRASLRLLTFAGAVAAAASLLSPSAALACGCFSSPIPTPEQPDYAVNQQSEQIIFERPGDGTVTAHVLIAYNGSPESFAWMVPVPSDPVLDLSNRLAFAILDDETRPAIPLEEIDLCPSQRYHCSYHDPCDDDWGTEYDAGGWGWEDTLSSPSDDASAGGGWTPTETPDGVELISAQEVGPYETVVFAADNGSAAVTWLQENAFIVNETMTPFMQPYLDAGMLFLAAKLSQGAEVSEIAPLKMTYQGDHPMVPLKLTAVGTEPHLTVTSYVFGQGAAKPIDQPLVDIPVDRLTVDDDGRSNYPMLLSRTIDEAGGAAFVREYFGSPTLQITEDDPSGCCDGSGGGFGFDASGGDICGLGGDGACQCPRADFDAGDCGEIPGLLESIALLDGLAEQYATLTRLTTRLSAEEMTFDPMFEEVEVTSAQTPNLKARHHRVDNCAVNVVDQGASSQAVLRHACSTTYCGPHGQCAATAQGAGCICDSGYVGRVYTELDGLPGITCIPVEHPVDYSVGLPNPLPSACSPDQIASGTCVDVGGFPATQCETGKAAVALAGSDTPTCVPTTALAGDAGAGNYRAALEPLDICWPLAPTCGEDGWLVEKSWHTRPGVECAKTMPDESAFVVPPDPCDEDDNPDDLPICDPVDASGGGSDPAPRDAGPTDVGPEDDTTGRGSGGRPRTDDGTGSGTAGPGPATCRPRTDRDPVTDPPTSGGSDDSGCAAGGPMSGLLWLLSAGLVVLAGRRRQQGSASRC